MRHQGVPLIFKGIANYRKTSTVQSQAFDNKLYFVVIYFFLVVKYLNIHIYIFLQIQIYINIYRYMFLWIKIFSFPYAFLHYRWFILLLRFVFYFHLYFVIYHFQTYALYIYMVFLLSFFRDFVFINIFWICIFVSTLQIDICLFFWNIDQ